MRKLNEFEQGVYDRLKLMGSICLGDLDSELKVDVDAAMKMLVKKKAAWVETTEDGPRYHAA